MVRPRALANGNGDSTTDAADYVLWRKFFGPGVPGSPASRLSSGDQSSLAAESEPASSGNLIAANHGDDVEVFSNYASELDFRIVAAAARPAKDIVRQASMVTLIIEWPHWLRQNRRAPSRAQFVSKDDDELFLSDVAAMTAQAAGNHGR